MKTKEELLSMNHEKLAEFAYKIMYEQCLMEDKTKENQRLKEILNAIGIVYESYKKSPNDI